MERGGCPRGNIMRGKLDPRLSAFFHTISQKKRLIDKCSWISGNCLLPVAEAYAPKPSHCSTQWLFHPDSNTLITTAELSACPILLNRLFSSPTFAFKNLFTVLLLFHFCMFELLIHKLSSYKSCSQYSRLYCSTNDGLGLHIFDSQSSKCEVNGIVRV